MVSPSTRFSKPYFAFVFTALMQVCFHLATTQNHQKNVTKNQILKYGLLNCCGKYSTRLKHEDQEKEKELMRIPRGIQKELKQIMAAICGIISVRK